MNTTNHHITKVPDGQGNWLWCVAGECFTTEKAAIERRRQLEEMPPEQPPPSPTPDDDIEPEKPPTA